MRSSILRIQVGSAVMLVGGDATLLSWSELPAGELKANVFRIPHHGGAIAEGHIPKGWDVDRLYREVGAETALVSVGTNNPYDHPSKTSILPVTGGACRLLCTQVTAKCHARLEVTEGDGSVRRDSAEIAQQRRRVITQQNQWVVPQYRHLSDKRHKLQSGLLEVPCAGSVVVTLYVDGRVNVQPTAGGGHDALVDDWSHPLCRPSVGAVSVR